MKSPRKVITGAQAMSLAQLALVGSVERTLDQGVQLGVRFDYRSGLGRYANRTHAVIIRRDGGMRSVIPSDHPLRRRVVEVTRGRKFGHLEVAA